MTDDTNLPGQNTARQAALVPGPNHPDYTPLRGQIAAALAKAQGAYPEIKKSSSVTITKRDGGSFSFKYAALDAILDAVRKPLSDNGLAITQVLDGANLITRLMHESGEYLEGTVPVPRGDDIKALGASITYLRRYSLQSMLGVAAEEDTDGPPSDGKPAAPSRLTATVDNRLRDTGRPTAPPQAPGPAPAAPVSGRPTPVAPVEPDEGGASADDPTPLGADSGSGNSTSPTDTPVGGDSPENETIPSADDGQYGLNYEEFTRMARERHILAGLVLTAARALWPDGEFKTKQDIEDLTDGDRWLLWSRLLLND